MDQSETWPDLVDTHGVAHKPGSPEYEQMAAFYRSSWSVSITSEQGERPSAVFPTLKTAFEHIESRMDSPGARAVIIRIDKEV